MKNHELVSALVDGELAGSELADTLEWLAHDAQARQIWSDYHVLGEALRSGEAASGTRDRDAAFMQRLQVSLAQEAPGVVVDDAINLIAITPVSTGLNTLKPLKEDAANDAMFRWKLWAGLASLAMVAVIGWQVWLGAGPPSAPALASVEPTGVMLRDPQLDALLAAHRQFAGTSALSMSAGFLQNTAFEEAAR